MPTEINKLDSRELFTQFSRDPMAWFRGVIGDINSEETPTLSRALEFVSPSEDGELDAYSRMLREAGIIVRSDPQAGFWASPSKRAFFDSPVGRALYTEFFARNWRKVSFASPAQRATLLSTDGTPGSWQRPYVDAATARWDQQIAPAIPLSELVGMTTPISGQDYRAVYLTYDAENLRKFRVGESAEIPITTLTDSENTIQLKKYGRGLRASYEQLRRTRVDKLARMIQIMAVQSEIDKVAAALDVLINGDGNSGTAATTHDLTTLDTAAVAGTLTLKGWLAFKMKFTNPYTITGSLMQEAVALQLALLNVGNANTPLVSAGLSLGTGLTPMNQFADGVRFGWTADAPALKIVGFDRRFALERVTEIGAEISEMEQFITSQTQVMTMTEVEGYAVPDGNATLILDVNA